MDQPDKALELIAALEGMATQGEIANVSRFYKGNDPATGVLGVSIGKVFPVAKAYSDLAIDEIERLLEDVHYEVRVAGVSVMDFQARRKSVGEAHRKSLYELYLRRHDRIDNWDMVDRAAPSVVGDYLVARDRSILDGLTRSKRPAERRTALVATYAFIRRGETEDTFRIAGLLAGDEDVYVQKAIASWTREAGKKDPAGFVEFLKAHRLHLARSTLTAATKFLPSDIRASLLSQ